MGFGYGVDQEENQMDSSQEETQDRGNGVHIMDSAELNETHKLQLAERANDIYRQQLKYMQDHLSSLRNLIQDKENIIENLMLRYDLGIIAQDPNRQGGNLGPDEIEMEELRRKAEALAQRTILENYELREMINELRDENFHLRNEIYELKDKINRQVLLINKLEKSVHQQSVGKVVYQDIDDEREQDDEDIQEEANGDATQEAESDMNHAKPTRGPSITDLGDMHIIPHDYLDNAVDEAVTYHKGKEARINYLKHKLKKHLPEEVAGTLAETVVTQKEEELNEPQTENQTVVENDTQKETQDHRVIMEASELNETQKLQLAERANEIYRQQLKYMQDHLASMRSLIQDKENIIENLMIRYDLGVFIKDESGQGGDLGPDEIEMEELRRKAEALAQRTILENFELREMVNELRDENFHLRNEIYELQDKINQQVLQINKLEKSIAESNTMDVFSQLRHEIGELQDKINEQVNNLDKTVQERVRNETDAHTGAIEQHEIDVSSITISQMKQTIDLSNRPTMETLVIAGVLEMKTVGQYYYTLDSNQINHMIREKIDYKANVIEVLQKYPDDTLHAQSPEALNVTYKKQKIYFLLQTVVSGHNNTRALITQEESEVRSLMVQMNVRMQTLRERLERHVDPGHPDLNTDEEELQTDFNNIQTRLSSIASKQKAIHQRLSMLHDVERAMMINERTFYKKYRSFLEARAMMDADIKQLQTLGMTDEIRQTIAGLISAKNNAQNDIHQAMIEALQNALHQHQQIAIARTQATHSVSTDNPADTEVESALRTIAKNAARTGTHERKEYNEDNDYKMDDEHDLIAKLDPRKRASLTALTDQGLIPENWLLDLYGLADQVRKRHQNMDSAVLDLKSQLNVPPILADVIARDVLDEIETVDPYLNRDSTDELQQSKEDIQEDAKEDTEEDAQAQEKHTDNERFKLTFQYSVFVVNLFHLQYVDTLAEPIKRTIAAYAADHLYIDPDLTVRDVVKQMDANTYTTQHRQTLLNRKDLLSLSVHRSVRIVHDTSDDEQCIPLHCFASEDICGTIEQWVHNDRKYNKYQTQTQNVFSKKRKWTGSKLSRMLENGYMSTNDIKSMLRMDLNSFISPDTLDIVFACFDRWMEDNPEIESLSAEEIGSIFYDFPLNQLLDTIRNKEIGGTAWVGMYAKQELAAFMKEQTGWDDEEIYQINAVLFMHKTWTKEEFMDNMARITNDETLGLASAFKEVIKQTILEFNVEKLHFKIKHGMEINAFSDTVINLVDYVQDMNDEYVKNGHADAYKEDDLVRRVYECIADCFILKYDDKPAELDEDHDVDEFSIRLDKQTPWICGNCSNFNFHKCIGGTIQSNVSICSLCGIHQRDAIILKLKNYDTYIMVSARKQRQYEEEDEETYGAIDSLIKTASDHPSYSLQCPNRNDDTPCPSMITLARNLILYKRWIDTVYKKTNGSDGIHKTIHIDIAKYIDDKQYQVVFMECAKSNRLLTAVDLELITQLLDDNTNDIGVCATFVGWKRLAFIKWFRKHSKRKIKPAALGRLYVTIKKALRKQAQVPQFGEFLSDIAMRGIDKDYYHILKTHVYQGTKETIKNAFRFFEVVVHYEDTHQQIEECRACKRRQDRISRDHDHQMYDANGEIQMKNRVRNTNHCDDKELWSLQQYYIQSQLDKIHSYLVHSNWKYFVQRYGTNNAAEDGNTDDDPLSKEEGKEMEMNMETDAMVTADAAAQKSKFTSDSDSYGFGVDHSYPHLTDKYCSIQDELVLNSLYPITVNDFQNLLIKSIKTHEIAMGKGYKEELVCKYFDLDYNILRNEPIQMRHILSLIIYTDLTQFCTALRQTYRKMNDETEEEEVSERHQQLYHYSRSLFEAVEFYGSYMEPHLTVYHGLNKVLYFNNFTAYFYQPISTTTSLAVANQFSNGGGIILSLKSGSGAQQSEDTIPKYLNVSWLSNFPHEDEKLFYGGYEVFQITNIIEAASSIGHAKELFMFNKFQQMIQNHKVEWNMKNKLEKKMVKALVTLIEHEQQSAAKESSQTIQNNKLITKYGMNLFHYFCANSETTRVEIKNVKSLPLKIYNALFTAQNNKLSFIPITNVFTCLQEMLLTELENGLFTKESKKYVDAAMQYIQQSKAHHTLSKITLQSERQRDRKTNATLRKLANYNAKKFKQLKWKIEYAFREYDTHILMFRKLD